MIEHRVSVSVAKKMLGCSGDTVRRLIKEGELDAIDIGREGAGRPTWSILRASVERYLEACKNRTDQEKPQKPQK